MQTVYFPVSIRKLVIMSVGTMGLYDIYWFLKNWQIIRSRDGRRIIPGLRAVFAIFFCYALFSHIRRTDASPDADQPIPAFNPLWITAGWGFTYLLGYMPFPLDMASFVSVLFLIPVQKRVNALNRQNLDRINENDRITGINLLWIGFAVLTYVTLQQAVG